MLEGAYSSLRLWSWNSQCRIKDSREEWNRAEQSKRKSKSKRAERGNLRDDSQKDEEPKP